MPEKAFRPFHDGLNRPPRWTRDLIDCQKVYLWFFTSFLLYDQRKVGWTCPTMSTRWRRPCRGQYLGSQRNQTLELLWLPQTDVKSDMKLTWQITHKNLVHQDRSHRSQTTRSTTRSTRFAFAKNLFQVFLKTI